MLATGCGDTSGDEPPAQTDGGDTDTQGDGPGTEGTTSPDTSGAESSGATGPGGSDGTGGTGDGTGLCDWEQRIPNPFSNLSSGATHLMVIGEGAIIGSWDLVEDPDPGNPQIANLRRVDDAGAEAWTWSAEELASDTALAGVIAGPDETLFALVSTLEGDQTSVLVRLNAANGEVLLRETLSDRFSAVATDDRSLWLAGSVEATTMVDLNLAHYTLDGAPMGTFPQAGLGEGWAQPRWLVADDSQIVVGGQEWERQSSAGPTVGMLRAFGPDGGALWGHLVAPEGSSDVQIDALTRAPNGDVVAIANGREGEFVTELYLSRWSSTGEMLWERGWSRDLVPGVNVFDRANGLAIAPDGSIYVAGSRLVAETEDATLQMLLAAWTADGEFVGHRMWGEATGDGNAATAVAFDVRGQMWTAGAWGNPGELRTDTWFRCEDPAALQWD